MEPVPKGVCVDEMKWYELLTPLYEPLEEMGQLCNARPPLPPTPSGLADMPLDNLPMFTGSHYLGSGDCFIRGDNLMNMNCRAPLHLAYMQQAHLTIGPIGDVTKQFMNYQHPTYEWPVNHPYAPTPPFHEEAMMVLPEGAKLPPVEMPNHTDPITPTRKVQTSEVQRSEVQTSKDQTSKKRKCESQKQDDEDKVYIKKPPNAFMIFRKEQRENVMTQLNIRDSAVANKVLGHMWKSLTDKEQEKYYQLADAEKRLHTQMHPNWSCTDNYGRKRRKQKCKAAT
ncbi:uncharacterized protein LOC144001357 isoform X2 [Festucalex cinctus]